MQRVGDAAYCGERVQHSALEPELHAAAEAVVDAEVVQVAAAAQQGAEQLTVVHGQRVLLSLEGTASDMERDLHARNEMLMLHFYGAES